MPEGPETHRDARQLAQVLAGQRLRDAWVKAPALRRPVGALADREVLAVRAWGKTMLIDFGDRTLYSHNQLYGKWFVTTPGAAPRTGRDLRLALHTASGSAWLYSASTIGVFDRGDHASVAILRRLGPDVLWPETDAALVRNRLLDSPWRTRRLASLLLDQHFLAGPGNYLRSEILFRARLDAELTPAVLTDSQLNRLVRQILTLPRRSLAQAGVLLTRRAQTRARRMLGGPRRFWVFARDDEPCLECGTLIARRESGGRRLYYCPQCQQTEG